MQLRGLALAAFALLPQCAYAEGCRFEFWEVIPPNVACDVFTLPAFTFRRTDHLPNESETFKRFCSSYLVGSAAGEQRAAYCYTGGGIATGPTFTVGSQSYVANFAFEGCRGRTPVKGLVFHPAYGTPAAAKAPLRPFQRENFKDPIRCD